MANERKGTHDDLAGGATLPAVSPWRGATPDPDHVRTTPLPAASLPATIDDELAAGSAAPPSRPEDPAAAPPTSEPVIVRAGRAEDYHVLATVDPARYVVGKEIARGGMGRIFTARDRRLGRTVAIKELLTGTSDLRTRFEREARITAKLQHPAIVNLLEAGAWPTGEPFYVMKLVAGQSLDHVVTARPTLAARLGLLPHIIAAVDALAYAHGQRVIHRDLKPANVLVGEFGETVVIDWGLAKDLSEASTSDVKAPPARKSWRENDGTTLAGSVLGTPAYMPAEQALGETVDERADVYALGALLYHVLAGAAPYTGKTASAILDSVTAGPPPSLASRARGIPPDLVAITNKAMAHAAADRYPTAKELADDLKKFQTGQLVGAHEYTAWQLARRWIRRHRTPVAVASVAIVLLAVVGALGVRSVVREQARTDQQRVAAERSRGDAEDLTTFMLGDLRAKLQSLGRLDLLDNVAKKAVAYYDARGADLTDAERGKLGLARRNLGDVLRLQKAGDLPGALQQYRASLEITQELAARAPADVQRQRDLTDSHDKIGEVVFAQGDANTALTEFRAASAIRSALPASDDTQSDLFISHGHIGAVLFARGDLPATLVEYRAALAIAEALAAKAPANTERQASVASSHSLLGDAIYQQGDAAAALGEYRAGLALDEAIALKDPANADRQHELAISHQSVGNMLMAQRKPADALPEYRAALAISEAFAAKDPTNASWQRALSVCHSKLGNVLYKQKDLPGALREYRADLDIAQTLAARDPTNAERQSDVSVSHNKIGNVLLATNDNAGALAEYRASVAITDALAAKDPTNTDRQRALSVGRNKTGDARAASGDTAGAIVEYRAAQAIIEMLAGKDPTNAELQVDVSVSHQRIGDALLALKDKPGALAEYKAGLGVAQALSAKDANNADAHEMVDTLTKNVASCCAP